MTHKEAMRWGPWMSAPQGMSNAINTEKALIKTTFREKRHFIEGFLVPVIEERKQKP